MMLTYDRGIVDRIIERRGLPFDENAEPCVLQVVVYDHASTNWMRSGSRASSVRQSTVRS